jgi:fused signal recognition particle receptor
MKVDLKSKLSRTRAVLKSRIDGIFQSGLEREEMLDELTESLILSDVGWDTADKIIGKLRKETRKKDSGPHLKVRLQEEIVKILDSAETGHVPDEGPSVIMFVGVNGGGKTTSLAKLAALHKSRGKRILMVAADTFRAAAQEQLTIWGKRLDIPVIRGRYGADPASVTYDALQSFKAKEYQMMLVDTAGRVHTNANLMAELDKIRKIISREIERGPQEVFLVLDASIGQNAIHQAREFVKFSGLTGIVLSKLDGSAKGGSVLSIVDELRLPIRYIGIGEGESDLVPFSPEDFTAALLS